MSEYIITDGTRFIYRDYSGKYVPTSNEALADIFNKKQAEGIFNNSLPKALKLVFHIQKYDEPSQNIKQVTQENLSCNTAKVVLDTNIQNWINRLSDLNGLAKDALNRKEILSKQLKHLEDELIDIEHYIEFQNLNAAQGYKASKELKECRIKRRAVKNELLVLDIILEQRINEMINEEVNKRIQGMDNRLYKPRIRTDLFDM